MEEHVIQATARSRTAAILKFGLIVAVACALPLSARLYSVHVAPLPVCDQLPWIRLVALTGVLGLLAFIVFFCRNGWMVWRSGQFPAPGASVLITQRVFRGWWANVNVASNFLIAAAAAVALAFWLKFFVFSQFGLYVLGLRGCGP